MHKNILLTTMSTLPQGFNTNYYHVQSPSLESKHRLYCDGIAQTEAGTKFFLSDTRIDHIVVIGSDKTYCVDEASRDESIDTFETSDLVSESNHYTGNEKKYAYRYYKYRIAQFLKGENAEQDSLASSIPEDRRRELEKLTSDFMYSYGFKDPNHWFDNIVTEAGSSLSFDLRQIIEGDIKKNFISEDQYKQYLQPVSNYPELIELEKDIDIIKEQIKDKTISLEKVKLDLHDRYFSSAPADLDYEARLFILSRRLEENITSLEIEQYITKSSAYRDLILRLKDVVDRLIMEIQARKTRRLDREISYIKSWLYRQMSADYMLRPKENATVSLTFVPDMKPGTDIYNISGIIDAIRACATESDPSLDLYIDMQGGSRTDGYVRNAILSILNKDSNSNIEIEKVVATDYEARKFASPIVDETSRYQVINLTSGMNAFIKYGRADLINDYLRDIPKESNVKQLVSAMVEIDHALSVCNITALATAIKSIRSILEDNDPSEVNEVNEIFHVLKDGIRNDYGALVSNPELDYYELASWAFKKGFYQQALTIIESKMPREFVRKGIFYYGDGERDNNIQQLKILYNNTDNKEKVYFDDIDNYFIKRYIHSVSAKVPKDSNKKKGTGKQMSSAQRSAQQMQTLLKPSSPDIIKAYTNCGVNNMSAVLEKYYIVSSLRNSVNHSSENNASFTVESISNAVSDFLRVYKKALSNIKQKDFHVTPITLADIKNAK